MFVPRNVFAWMLLPVLFGVAAIARGAAPEGGGLPPSYHPVTSMALAPDSKRLAVARGDQVLVFDAQSPERPVVISFDDGYRSHSTAAAPVLRTLGWPGVLNLEINNVGRGGISLGRLRGLVRDGWEIGSHTVHHPNLTTLGPVALRSELVRSRAWIHRRLGVDPAFFCYPAGRFDAAVVAAVRAAGYHGATTELPGPATAREDPYRLPRVRVTGSESADAVLAALTSHRARDGAGGPQTVPTSGAR